MALDYEKATVLHLKSHPDWDERFVEKKICEDPSILGLGDLDLVKPQKSQKHGGRLDVLLQSSDDYSMYEVEIQLGATDPSHIIRTIEYWDEERRRYPEVSHTAIIIAEEITSRFFNVIALFNQHIPLIAIKLSAIMLGGKTTLLFTRILDYTPKASAIDVAATPSSDRSVWVTRAGEEALRFIDSLLEPLRSSGVDAQPNFTQSYIGVRIGQRVNNFVTFRPKKQFVKINLHVEQLEELDSSFTALKLDTNYRGFYQIRVPWADCQRIKEPLARIIGNSFELSEQQAG